MQTPQKTPSPPELREQQDTALTEKPGSKGGDDSGNDEQACQQILKSSALIGGSTLLNILISVVRTKTMAVLLGPAGFGLMGMYSAIIDVANSFAGMGVNGSGVRQIAEASASGNMERLARTAAVLRKISVLLGLFSAGLLVVFASQVSQFTFGDQERSTAVAMLSMAIFCSCIAMGQGALLQGMRRISDLARMGIYGTALGTLISVSMVYCFGEWGLVPSLIFIAAAGAFMSWWYGRKIQLPKVALGAAQLRQESAALMKLGFAFLASALMNTGAAYVVRLLLTRDAGIHSAGLYQAAWTLGGLYVGFILQAMGTDFYPRLTSVARDDPACNRMVNQQAQISLLLAGPGVLATITFAPLVIALFYTPDFLEAVNILRWICLGMALRVIVWPMGFVILAKGVQALFFWTEFAWTTVYLALVWLCVDAFGPVGAGMAFLGSYLFHGLLIYFLVHKLSGFEWESANKRAIVLFLLSSALVFCGLVLLPPLLGIALGIIVTAVSSIFSIRAAAALVSLDLLPPNLARLLVRFHLVRDTSAGSEPETCPILELASKEKT